MLHGALGSVDVYRYLIPEMEKQNCGEIISIGISDLDEYCKLESEEVVLHLADLYTQKILALKFPSGYCDSGGSIE